MQLLNLRLAALLAISWASPACGVCQDESSECAGWAESGECERNPAYMHVSCKKACGKCPRASTSRPQKPSSDGASKPSASASAAAPKAEDILGDGTYSLHVGKLTGRSLHSGPFTLQAAREWCDKRGRECAGFHVQVQKPTPMPAGPLFFQFRTSAPTVVDDLAWVSFVRTAGSTSAAGGSAGAGQCDEGDCKGASAASSVHSTQVARYYLRAAELASYKGSAAAQEVIDQVRAALLSGANREECYMLRALAYLHQQNVDKCKGDLSAILRNDPEHAAAAKLHRKVKKYQRALDDGVKLEQGRQHQPAVDKFRAALEAFSPPLETSALRLGMCRCQLKLRQSAEAARWCDKAYKAEPENLEVLFSLADAKSMLGEDHAGLQLLKTAQYRFRKSMELMQKIQRLENRIKQQSKVNYYKVLGVTRSATQKEVKRAYHKLAMKYHPDKVTEADDKPTAEAMFKKIARAYEVLGDEAMRRRYDNGEDVDDANAMNQRQQQQQHNPFGGFGGGGQRHHFRHHGFR